MICRCREWLSRWDGSPWDFFVIYVVPERVFRPWMRWVYQPVRYGIPPWDTSSTIDSCPVCKELEDK